MLTLVVLAGGVVLGVHALMRHAERAAVAPVPASEAPGARVQAVEAVLSAMGLITVRIETTVTAESADESWRGDVRAASTAPVTMYFGCDLAAGPGGTGAAAGGITVTRVSGEGIGGGSDGGGGEVVRVRLPQPRLLAVEVRGAGEKPKVRVTGLRFRDLSGEYHLGIARLGLWDRARAIALEPQRQREVEAISREQVGALVRSILGPGTRVEVEFVRGEEPAAETGAGP